MEKKFVKFFVNSFLIQESYSGFWVSEYAGAVIAGPFGTLIEARDFAESHSIKEFETRMFLKADKAEKIANGILNRQPNLFTSLSKK